MSDLNIGVIVQARMGSTRLPGKVLKKLDENISILSLLIKRLKLSKEINNIIVATTIKKENKQIIDLAMSLNVDYFVGSEENVLERYFLAAKKYSLDIIIRITSDCPFLDPYILDEMIIFYKNNKYDYVSNVHTSSNFPRGFEIEIFSFKVLEKVYNHAASNSFKEHVTLFIYKHPEIFSIHNYQVSNLKTIPNLRLTVDEIDDYKLIKVLYNKLKNMGKEINFSLFDIIEIIEKEPNLIEINKHVQQKKV